MLAVLRQVGQSRLEFRIGRVQSSGAIWPPCWVCDGLQGIRADDVRLQVWQRFVVDQPPALRRDCHEQPQPRDLHRKRVNVLSDQLPPDDIRWLARIRPQFVQRPPQSVERTEQEHPRSNRRVEYPQFLDTLPQAGSLLISKFQGGSIFIPEQVEELRVRYRTRGAATNRRRQCVLHHLIRDVRRSIVRPLWLPQGRLRTLLRRGNQPLKQVAQQLRIQGLLTLARSVFVHRPVVA